MYKGISSKGSRRKNPFRSIGRAFGAKTPALESWVSLLPQGDYSFVACGALKLIYGAAVRSEEVRKLVFGTLASFNDIMNESGNFLQLYAEDDELQCHAEELYIALLEAVESMMRWLDKKAWKKVCHSFFQQEFTDKQLEDKITVAVAEKAEQLHKRAEFCFQQRMAGVAETVQTLEAMLKYSARMFEQYCKDQQGQALQSNNSLWLTDGTEFEERLTSMLQQQAARQLLPANQNFLEMQPSPPPLLSDTSATLVTTADLAAMTAVDPQHLAHDMLWALIADTHTAAREHRADFLMHEERLQDFLKNTTSDILLVYAVETDWPAEIPSSTSYFVSLLASALSDRQAAIPVTFFCASHAQPGDHLEGPRGLMRALNHQLLTRHLISEEDLSASLTQTEIAGLASHTFDSLCGLFQKLVVLITQRTQLPIFCLIDGISWFENAARREDTAYALTALREVVDFANETRDELGIIIKVLIADSSIVAQRLSGGCLKGVDVISLPDTLVLEQQSMLTDDLGELLPM